LALVRHFERVLALDRPISVHLTGCPNSCAQHLIADIGLLGTKVERGEDVIEGYTVYVGGEAGTEKLGRELWRSVPFDELPRRLESLIRSYISQRRDSAESFRDFTERQSIDDLIGLCRTSV
jgi:ferredoxin-nitrite reductase